MLPEERKIKEKKGEFEEDLDLVQLLLKRSRSTSNTLGFSSKDYLFKD